MEKLDTVPRDFWHDVAAKCPWATYFHTPGWAEIIAGTFPEFTVSSIGLILDSGSRTVIPSVLRRKKGLLRHREYKSMEPGVYGGIIADRDLSRDEVAQIDRCILKKRNSSGRLVESPFKQFSLSSRYKSKKMTTHILSLEPGVDLIRKKFSRGQKSNINQAKRKNVAVRRAETEDDVEQYYYIYQQTVERWGTGAKAAYPQRFFMNIFLQKDPDASFWLAEIEGRTVAGIVVLSWNTNIIYWHGCALKEYFKFYPNNLLHSTVI